jgi:hypothetical protein
MKYRIWSVKDQKHLSREDIRSYRLALSLDGEVYSGEFDGNWNSSAYIVDMCSEIKDSEGQLIFEGDILENHYGVKFLCEYCRKDGCFNFIPIEEHPAYEGPYMWAEIQPAKVITQNLLWA